MLPPHDMDAEKAVIGAMLVSETAAAVAVEKLSREDFYSETHRIIYSAILKVLNTNSPVDRISVSNELAERDEYDRVGGRAYIFEIVDSVPTTANAHRYADIIRDKATLRNLLDAGASIQATAYSEPDSVSDAIDDAEQTLYAVASRGRNQDSSDEGPVGIGELTVRTITEMQERYESEEDVHGVLSGISDLDRITTGVRRGDLAVLAARPAMGKSAFSLGYALYAAGGSAGGGPRAEPTVIFSLEMSKEQLSERLLSHLASVPLRGIRSGDLTSDQWSSVFKATGGMQRMPLWIDDSASTTVPKMRAKLRRISSRLAVRGEKVGLVIVDYLQLMGGTGGPRESREAEVAEISRGLKVLARDLDVPVLALAQLSRAVEQRNDKRPMLSDLRNSGAIEQDADLVMFLYRDEYYNPDSEDRGIAEIIVGKHRNGPTGKASAAWIEREARFATLRWRDET